MRHGVIHSCEEFTETSKKEFCEGKYDAGLRKVL